MSGKFDNVDLGNDKTMQRMVKAKQEERNVVIDECVKKLEEIGYLSAANHIRGLKCS